MRTSSLLLALVLALAPAAHADDIEYQDGRKASDTLVSVDDGEATLKQGGDVSLGMIKSIAFAKVQPSKAPHAIELAGGDRILGTLSNEPVRGVAITNALIGLQAIPARQIALVDFGGSEKIPAERAGEEDILYVRTKKPGVLRGLKGAMESLDAKQIVFHWRRGGRKLTLEFKNVRALRMGKVKPPEVSDELTVAVTLTDGSRLTAEELTLEDGTLEISTPAGADLEIKRAAVASLAVTSDWVLYLARTKPIAVDRDRLYEHGIKAIDWPLYLVDKTIYGQPLGNKVRTGIGTYGTTRLTWDIKSRYKTFAATAWVATPPGTRANQAQGAVRFRVYADGEKIFDSGLVKAGAKPKKIEVEVSDVRRLTLEVDRGKGWGVGDAGTWGDPRVHK